MCQRAKPEIVDLGEKFSGKIKFVRMNVDHAESRAAVQKYGVRATPTFVVLDAAGNVLTNIPGYPGYSQFEQAFNQLLGES